MPFLPVVYEDEEILVLHKHSGVPSAPLQASESHTAVGSALAHFPALQDVSGRRPLEPGLIHRLDTGTSGLLVFAKTIQELERLIEVWKARRVKKTYRARVTKRTRSNELPGDPRAPVTWSQGLAHSAKSSKRMLVLDPSVRPTRNSEIRGKPLPAITHLRQVRPDPSNSSPSSSGWDFELEIETGVMHQIRAHLAHAGFPIQGDSIYGGIESSRLWLHAWRLELPLCSGVKLVLEAALPW